MPVTAVAARARAVRGRAVRAGRRLRFATVAIDQFGGGAPREPEVRPLCERVTALEGRANDALGNELVKSTSTIGSRCRAGGNQFGDDAAVCRDGDTLARL